MVSLIHESRSRQQSERVTSRQPTLVRLTNTAIHVLVCQSRLPRLPYNLSGYSKQAVTSLIPRRADADGRIFRGSNALKPSRVVYDHAGTIGEMPMAMLWFTYPRRSSKGYWGMLSPSNNPSSGSAILLRSHSIPSQPCCTRRH